MDIKPLVMITFVVDHPLWATTGRIIRKGGEEAGEVVEIAGVEAGEGALGREEEGAGEVIEVDQGHPQVATLRGGDLVMAEISTARIIESPATGGDQMPGERQVLGLRELRPLLLLTQERQILGLTLGTWGLPRRTTPRRLPSSLLAWGAEEDLAEEGCLKLRITINIGRKTAWWSMTAPAKVWQGCLSPSRDSPTFQDSPKPSLTVSLEQASRLPPQSRRNLGLWLFRREM